MSTEPKTNKDISIKGIFWALLIFTTTTGIMAFAVYRYPTNAKLIQNLAISFLSSLGFMVVLNSRGKTIEASEKTSGKIGKDHKKFILKVLVFWVAFFILISSIKI